MKLQLIRAAFGVMALAFLAASQNPPAKTGQSEAAKAGQTTSLQPPATTAQPATQSVGSQPPATATQPPTTQSTGSQPPQGEQQPPRFVGGTTVVSMAFSVTDRKGRFVTGLKKEDFELFEEGKGQVIQEFTAEPTLPLRVAVLIDTSNSIRDRFKFEQEAAVEFLGELLRSTVDKAMVVSFDSTPEIVCNLTDDVDRLGTAIRALRPGGGTAMYDAIAFASNKLAEEQPGYKYRRLMVIVTDGDDNQSHSTRDQALESAQLAETFVYAISTNNLGQGDSDGDKVLRYFTGKTGGKPYFPFKLEDLTQSFDVIADEVRHQYAILYRPDVLPRDGSFRRVEIRVKAHKELTVRARAGYFAGKS